MEIFALEMILKKKNYKMKWILFLYSTIIFMIFLYIVNG